MARYPVPKLISISDFKDDQEAIWFYNFLSVRGWLQNDRANQALDNTAIKTEVIESIRLLHTRTATYMGLRNPEEIFFRDIRAWYNASLLKKNDYHFIAKLNNRLQNAIWLHITTITLPPPEPNLISTTHAAVLEQRSKPYLNLIHLPSTPVYRLYTINRNPLTPAELTDSIIKFFQIWEDTAEVKKYHLGLIRDLIEHIHDFRNAFKWLDKSNQSQCSWATHYMQTQGLFLEQFPVTTNDSLYNAVIGSFDCWSSSKEAKLLFLEKMKRAWSVKKYRDKQEGKKPYSFVMSKKISKMLDNLTSESDVSKSQLVEELIIREHSNKIKR